MMRKIFLSLIDAINKRAPSRVKKFMYACAIFLIRDHSERSARQQATIVDITEQDIRGALSVKEGGELLRCAKTINWFLSVPGHFTAGPHNIFSLAQYFASLGKENRFIFSEGDAPDLVSSITKRYPKLRGSIFMFAPKTDEIPISDISIATFWTTVFPMLQSKSTGQRYYLIQDDERLFYPASELYTFAELTYKLRLPAIASSKSILDWYRSEFGGNGIYFNTVPDLKLFYPGAMPKDHGGIKNIFFYARPHTQRNGFYVGIEALRRIKRMYPHINIFLAGEKLDPPMLRGLEGFIKLGDITLEQSAHLYRDMDVGIYLMFTRHPGILPLEFMVSGCVTLTNRRDNVRDILQDGENCLMVIPTVSGLVSGFQTLYNNPDRVNRIRENGIRFVQKFSQQDEYRKVFEFLFQHQTTKGPSTN